MASTKTKISSALNAATQDAELHLMGATRLGEFLQFVRQRAIGGRDRDECEVADLWRASAQHYKRLQTSELGTADKPKVLPIPNGMQNHLQKLAALKSFTATFSSVPIAFGMVPLKQLVCSQFDLTVSTLKAIGLPARKRLSPTKLAELCLPIEPAHGQCVLGRETAGEYIFHSDSHDIRSFTAQLVPVENISGYHPRGHAKATIVLGIGFSTNVLNVIRYADRLVLNNGYHRAFSLLQQGHTHAPCVIQVCGSSDDLGQSAMREINQNQDLYFSQSRPPMLRDYLDHLLTSLWPIVPIRRQITVKVSYESRDIAQSSYL